MAKILIYCILLLVAACAPLDEYRKVSSMDNSKERATQGRPMAAPAPAGKESSSMPRIEVTPGTTEITNQKFEDISKQLYTANMAYTVPDRVNIKDSFKIQLLIDPTKGIGELLDALTVSGNKNARSIKVSRVVNAKITAPDFNVVEVSPADQVISNSSSTEWLWNLTPKEVGKHEINITVTALITVDGKSSTHHLKTYESSVVIDVTASQLISEWLKKYWQWLLTTFIIPLGIWIYKNKSNKKTN